MRQENESLAMILEAREQRWAKRQAYAQNWSALLSMTLCVPMPLRVDPLAVDWFQEAWREVLNQLALQGFYPTVLEREIGPDGPMIMAGFQKSAQELKRACVAAEQLLEGGRFLDLDVTAKGGEAISRRDLELPPRRCFLCGRPAVECASRGLHPREEILNFVRSWLESHSASYSSVNR